MKEEALRFTVGKRTGDVSAVVLQPSEAEWGLVLGHGAGAGMHHPFMESASARLAQRKIATFRYQFPYMEAGSRRPDPPGVLTATVRAAFAVARTALAGLPLFAGGKSMGGRMTSLTAARGDLPGVEGLVFFGFPLHPAGRPSTDRAAHLAEVITSMLFLQGTRDSLASLELLSPICDRLGRRVELHIVDGADHSFHMLKKSARTDEEVLDELADVVAGWIARLGG